MKSILLRPFFRHIARQRFLYLLIAIIGFIIGGPFLMDILPPAVRFIKDLFITIIFITASYALSSKKKQLVISILLAIPLLAFMWSHYAIENYYLEILGQFFAALFFGFTVICLADFIFSQKEVTKEVITAALIIYLLLALVWTFIYSILASVNPNSFSLETGHSNDLYHFMYFSFVTLTTLGYGDITPLTDKAGALVILEAVVGQVYLVVVVAWLVGMHVSRRSK